MMPARKQPPKGGELLTIVKQAPRPTPPLKERGELLFTDDIVALLKGKKSRWYVNHSFLPSKKVKIGRTNAWWEMDVLAAIDRGELSA